MGTRKRTLEADYLDVSATGSTAKFALCGTGFSKLDESPSAQTSKKQYINMESASQHVTGYEWSASFEADQIKDEEAISFIRDIANGLKTGDDAETDFVQVDLDDPVTETPGSYHARKRRVAISVSDLPNNDGELGANGDFLGVSDPVKGTFDTATKTFTADA